MAGPQRFHWLRLRATAHATEDVERVVAAVRAVAGDVELVVEETAVDGHHGGSIVLLEAAIGRNRPIRDTLARLVTAAPSVRGQLGARVDDEGVLYLRFDKQAAFEDNALRLVDHADAVQVRARIEVHPVRKDLALAAWEDWFDA